MRFHGITGLHHFLVRQKSMAPLLFDSVIVGVLAGLVGGGFRLILTHLEQWRNLLYQFFSGHMGLSLAVGIGLPAIGVLIAVWLVRRFAPETSGSGVQEIEGALDGLRTVRWRRVLPVKFFASLFSLGSGMVMGREGPTIQMGAALGKMIGEKFHRKAEEVHMLLAAGAAAGLSSAFNAPFAGMIFVIEEMRSQYKYSFYSYQFIIIATAVSDIVVRGLTRQGPIIEMTIYAFPPLESLWLYPLIGIIFGIVGFWFNRLIIVSLDLFSSKRNWSNLITGFFTGATIGLVGWMYPELIGGGYEVISDCLSNSFTVQALLLLFGARFFLTLFSYGSGAPGGIFAPMLVIGTLLGSWFGIITHDMFPNLVWHQGMFAIAGMVAMFSATVKAPLTGLALAVEMTGNFNQILPLALTCIGATLVSYRLGSKPIYAVLLERTLDREQPEDTNVKDDFEKEHGVSE